MTQEAGSNLLLRVVSKGIDFVLIFAASEALPKAGWLAGLGYLLISDGLFEGKSAGKKLTGLMVLSSSGTPCSIKDSIMRNSTLGLGVLLWKIPVLGWVFLAAVLAVEFIILFGSKEGKRLGDEIAQTTVVETKKTLQET